jgi:hypothetical protein
MGVANQTGSFRIREEVKAAWRRRNHCGRLLSLHRDSIREKARHGMHEVRLQEAARLARVLGACGQDVWSVSVRDLGGMPIVNYLFSSEAQVDAFANEVRPLGFTRICTAVEQRCTICDFALDRRAANERLAHPDRRKGDH